MGRVQYDGTARASALAPRDGRRYVAPMPRPRPRARFLTRAILVALLAGGTGSCASVHFERESETAGTFSSSAVAFTFLSYDLPNSALSIARGNAADSGLSELVIENEAVFPYLWRLDWLLDIISIRRARIEGTWGFSGNEARERDDFGDF